MFGPPPPVLRDLPALWRWRRGARLPSGCIVPAAAAERETGMGVLKVATHPAPHQCTKDRQTAAFMQPVC